MTPCCQKNVLLACELQDATIRDLRAEVEALRQAPPVTDAVLAARLELATDTLGALLASVARDGGYRSAEAQATLRGARAVHEELTRGGRP